jgi:prepilin-type N-terminal cleavage/methylation domain-containing protein/prepilin-type processing-associated H-X9-DG protein
MHYGSNRYVRAASGRGFSLIELLVAMAVVALLVTIGASAHSRVQMMADQTQCASNMRQIGVALRMYANANGGDLPGIAHGRPREESWIFTLAPYLDDSNAVRLSPADPLYEEKRRHNSATTYLMNDFIFLERLDPFGEPIPGFPPPSFNNIEHPQRTILAFTERERTSMLGLNLTNDHTHATNWTNWSRVLSDISPDLHRIGKQSSDRTKGSSNYLFADGRVESIPAADMKALIERGINFADPKVHW